MLKTEDIILLGEKYSYVGSGSSSSPEVIPPILSTLIDKLKADYDIKGTPNSILVNYYPKSKSEDRASYLPYHCDDELVITPGTDIITISLKAARSITFKSIHNQLEKDTVLETAHNSLYTMSCSSHAWYKHGIDSPTEDCEERFSITMGCVNDHNRRSVLIVGDSNTKKLCLVLVKVRLGKPTQVKE
jgi:alkylated DNA repair dioxygenase AlkB